MSMRAVLQWVTWRHLMEHRFRTVSTVLGVAFGVAAMVALQIVNDGASRAFEKTVRQIAGKAVLQVDNGEAGVPESLLAEIRQLQGVKVAAPLVHGFVPVIDFPGEQLYLFGIDFGEDQQLRAYEVDSSQVAIADQLTFLAQQDSVALTEEFLTRHHLKEGSAIVVRTPMGSRRLTIRGVLSPREGPATLFGGRVALLDVFAAQHLFGLDGRFSQIDVGIEDGVSVAQVEGALTQLVAGRGVVERSSERGETLERFLAGNRVVFSLAAMLAIVVGLYVVFNTMTIAVAQRRREIGLLRCVGLRSREVMALVVLESLVLGVLGATVGIGLGIGIAYVASPAFVANVSARFMRVDAPDMALRPLSIGGSAALGIISALLAALAPARAAVRVQPVAVLRPALSPATRVGFYGTAAAAGAALMVAGLAGWLSRSALGIVPELAAALANVGLITGIALAAPTILGTAVSAAERVLGRVLGPLGLIASRNLRGHVARVALTSSAFLVSVAGAMVVASLVTSLDRSVHRLLDNKVGTTTLLVGSASGFGSDEPAPVPQQVADDIRHLPGVEDLYIARRLKVPFRGLFVYLTAVDASSFRRKIRGLDLVDGDAGPVLDAFERGQGVMVSEPFANQFRVRRGDLVSFSSPNGAITLPVAAIWFDTKDIGEVFIDRTLYRRAWGDDTVNYIAPVLSSPATDRERVSDMIRKEWGERLGLFVFSVEQLREEMNATVRSTVFAAYPLVLVTLVIALVGVVNSLLASVLDRTHDIGILRAVGATRRQIARTVMIEGSLIGLVGAFFGVLAGSAVSYLEVEMLLHYTFGVSTVYHYPTFVAGWTIVLALVLSATAGQLPGRRAAGLSIRNALQHE